MDIVAAVPVSAWATAFLVAAALCLGAAIAVVCVLLLERPPSLFRRLMARGRSAPAPDNSRGAGGPGAIDLDAWRREFEQMKLEDLERFRQRNSR
jgi:hypothetical protein